MIDKIVCTIYVIYNRIAIYAQGIHCKKIHDCSRVYVQIHDCCRVFRNQHDKLSVTKYSTAVGYLHRYTTVVEYLEINMSSSVIAKIHDCTRVCAQNKNSFQSLIILMTQSI